MVIGYMGNNVYPVRAGEVIRSYTLRRNLGVPMSASLATILVERVFDGLVMLLFVLAALPFVALPEWLRFTVVAASVLFGVALLVLVGMAMQPDICVFIEFKPFTIPSFMMMAYCIKNG